MSLGYFVSKIIFIIESLSFVESFNRLLISHPKITLFICKKKHNLFFLMEKLIISLPLKFKQGIS